MFYKESSLFPKLDPNSMTTRRGELLNWCHEEFARTEDKIMFTLETHMNSVITSKQCCVSLRFISLLLCFLAWFHHIMLSLNSSNSGVIFLGSLFFLRLFFDFIVMFKATF